VLCYFVVLLVLVVGIVLNIFRVSVDFPFLNAPSVLAKNYLQIYISRYPQALHMKNIVLQACKISESVVRST